MPSIDRREYLEYAGSMAVTPLIAAGGRATAGDSPTGERHDGRANGGPDEPPPAPTALRADYRHAPNNVPVLTDPATGGDGQQPYLPRFSWRVPAEDRGTGQTAYRVLVASAPGILAQDIGDVWDSGTVESGRSTNVHVKPDEILEPDGTYHWKVRIRDDAGRTSDWSAPARFTMAILDTPDAWDGTWIGLDDPVPMQEPSDVGPVQNRDSPLLRRTVTLDKPVSRARAHVLTLGWGELYVNGDRIGDDRLNPGWSRFEERSLYTTYDVGDRLSEGENALGLWLGRGWFSKTAEVPLGIIAAGQAPNQVSPQIAKADVPQYPTSALSHWDSHGAPRALLQVNVEYEDGTGDRIVTDGSWQGFPSPIVENDVWDGEHYNALLEQPGWATTAFDATTWAPATELGEPSKWSDFGGASDPALRPMQAQPIEVTDTLDPVSIHTFEGDPIVDLGQNVAGWIELRVRDATSGQRIELRHAEVLTDDGDIDQRNLRTAEATDVYTAAGDADGEEVFEPRFTYHGFRYVKVLNYPGELRKADVTGKVVHTAFETRGSFTCSNEELNRVQHNAEWGLRSNAHSIPTDCPQRDERVGWTGDAHMAANADLYNHDVARFYEKWLRDHADAQAPSGAQADTVPWAYGGKPGDPNWGKTQVVIPWFVYRHTGDETLLERFYDDMTAYVDFWHRQADDHIIPGRYTLYGDWLAPEGPGIDPALVATFAHYQTTEMVAMAASVLDETGDARTYADRTDAIGAAFNREFFDPATNTYGSGAQKSFALPIYLDIVPDGHEAAVVDNLVAKMRTEDGGKLMTGFVATRPLIYGLADNGHEEFAYHVVSQPEHPGWVYMVRNGATTMWERWNSDEGAPEMNSYNHRPWTLVSEWFYERLAGINIAEAGFEHVEIAPMVVGDLRWADASVDTVRGDVTSRWERTDGGLSLTAGVPWNATATVRIPDLGYDSVRVTESGRIIWSDGSTGSHPEGVESVRRTDDAVVVRVGSGTYEFELEPTRASGTGAEDGGTQDGGAQDGGAQDGAAEDGAGGRDVTRRRPGRR